MTRAEKLAERSVQELVEALEQYLPGEWELDRLAELARRAAAAEALAEAVEALPHNRFCAVTESGGMCPCDCPKTALARYRGEKPSSIRTLVEGRDE